MLLIKIHRLKEVVFFEIVYEVLVVFFELFCKWEGTIVTNILFPFNMEFLHNIKRKQYLYIKFFNFPVKKDE